MRNPHEGEHNCKRQVGNCRWVSEGLPSDEDEDACDEQDGTETTEEVADGLAKPSGRRWGWLVGSDFFGDAQNVDDGKTGASRA